MTICCDLSIAESLESIPPVMFEVLGTVLEAVPERNTARVYRTPRTDGAGAGNPAETLIKGSGRAQRREDCLPD